MVPFPRPVTEAEMLPSELVAQVVGVDEITMLGLKGLLLTFAQLEAVHPTASVMVKQNCPIPTFEISSVEAV
jgi:hypothetical protein